MTYRNTIFAALLTALLAIGMVGMPVAASDDVLIDETIEIDDDVEEIWTDVTAVDDLEDTDEVEVTVTLEDGDEEIDTATLNVAGNETDSYSYELTDSDQDLDDLDLTVEVTDDEFTADDIESAEWGTVESMVGGGSSGGVAGFGTTGLVALLVLVGGAWYYTQQ